MCVSRMCIRRTWASRDMVKTPDELALMHVSGKMLASVFEMLDRQDLAGMSTLQVNDLVDRFITVDLAARPASKGQYGFKYVLNCAINHVVCHGVPGPARSSVTVTSSTSTSRSKRTASSRIRARPTWSAMPRPPRGGSCGSPRRRCGKA